MHASRPAEQHKVHSGREKREAMETAVSVLIKIPLLLQMNAVTSSVHGICSSKQLFSGRSWTHDWCLQAGQHCGA